MGSTPFFARHYARFARSFPIDKGQRALAACPPAGMAAVSPPRTSPFRVKENKMSFEYDYGQRTEFELVEPGVHNAVIDLITEAEGPQGRYLNLRFKVEGSDSRVWDILSLAPKASWRVTRLARDLGVASDEVVTYETEAEFVEDLQNRLLNAQCRVMVVVDEEYNNNKVTKIEAPAHN